MLYTKFGHMIICNCTHSHVSLCMPKSAHAVHVALLLTALKLEKRTGRHAHLLEFWCITS